MVLITALYAALLIMVYLYLSFNVFQTRVADAAKLDKDEEEEMRRAIRMHGSFSEYVPLILLLFVMLELNGTSDLLVHILGIILLAGRLIHVWGLSITSGISKPRVIGTVLTWLVMALCSSLLLLNFFDFVY